VKSKTKIAITEGITRMNRDEFSIRLVFLFSRGFLVLLLSQKIKKTKPRKNIKKIDTYKTVVGMGSLMFLMRGKEVFGG
jgi:hypothetical protein